MNTKISCQYSLSSYRSEYKSFYCSNKKVNSCSAKKKRGGIKELKANTNKGGKRLCHVLSGIRNSARAFYVALRTNRTCRFQWKHQGPNFPKHCRSFEAARRRHANTCIPGLGCFLPGGKGSRENHVGSPRTSKRLEQSAALNDAGQSKSFMASPCSIPPPVPLGPPT